jgi:hypothetical protein
MCLLIFWTKHRTSLFEDESLRRGEERIGDWRRLHSEEFLELSFSSDVTKVTKSKGQKNGDTNEGRT